MKKLIVFLFLPIITVIVCASPQIWNNTLTPTVTALAASSTNSTAGTVQELVLAQRPMRIYLKCNGYDGTTNGSLVVKFQTSTSTNSPAVWDTAATSNIKLTMTSLGTATNCVSDWFEVAGVKYIRVGQMENTFLGAVSNIVIWISTPRD